MKLDNQKAASLRVLGTRFTSGVSCLAATTEVGLATPEGAQGKPEDINPDLRFCWSGFQIMDPHEKLQKILTQLGGVKFGVCGAGIIIVHPSLLLTPPRTEDDAFNEEDSKVLIDIVGNIFLHTFKHEDHLVIDIPELDYRIQDDGTVAIQITVSTPCSEEDYRGYFQLHRLELNSVRLAAPSQGVGLVETSDGKQVH